MRAEEVLNFMDRLESFPVLYSPRCEYHGAANFNHKEES